MKKARLDNLDRIVIPKAICRELRIRQHSPVTISLEDGAVVIRPDAPTCRLCGAQIPPMRELPLCDICINKTKQYKI